MASELISNIGHTVPLVVGAALLIFAALHDIAARTIPNFVSALLIVLGLALRLPSGQLLSSAILAAIMFAVCTACWLRGWMGGGDVKLLTAAAVFVPPGNVGDMVVATTLFGGAVGLAYLLARAIVRRTRAVPRSNLARPPIRSLIGRVIRAEHWRLLRGAPLPYASAIAAGTLFVTMSG